MPTVMITGANRGLGFEFARQYCDAGWKVVATCRHPDAADDLHRLVASHPGQIDVVQLDVTDELHLERVSRELAGNSVDVLVNNANEFGPMTSTLECVGYSDWPHMFAVNCIGQLRVSQAIIPLLERSPAPKIATIGTKMASITLNTSGASYLYRTSKAALHAAMRSLAMDLRAKGIIVAVLHPGWVPTPQAEETVTDPVFLGAKIRRGREILRELGGRRELMRAEDSVHAMRQVIDTLSLAETGSLLDWEGRVIPW